MLSLKLLCLLNPQNHPVPSNKTSLTKFKTLYWNPWFSCQFPLHALRLERGRCCLLWASSRETGSILVFAEWMNVCWMNKRTKLIFFFFFFIKKTQFLFSPLDCSISFRYRPPTQLQHPLPPVFAAWDQSYYSLENSSRPSLQETELE